MIAAELGLAQSTAGQVGERHIDHKAQLGNMLADIEGISNEQVAMEILALKTRLEAQLRNRLAAQPAVAGELSEVVTVTVPKTGERAYGTLRT